MQLALAATVAVLQEVTEFVKSAGLFPAAEIFEMCIGVVPLLMMATVMGTLARPCVVTGKVTEVGINLSAGPGGESIPVPISATDCGLPDALSVKINAASRTPTAEGVNVSFTMHEALGGRGTPMQVLVGALKSAGLLPPRAMAVITVGAFPGLVTVTV